MYVQVKTAGGCNLVPMQTLQLSKRRVYIRGEITMESACRLADQVMLLNDESTSEHIDLFITSPGGDVRAGMLMYDIIHSSGAPIRMYCLGEAYSMAAFLFASGTNGRFMLFNSELMLHEPLLGNAVRGNVSSVRAMSEELIAVSRKLNQMLSLHTGRTVEEIEEACGYDHFFTAQESVDFGLADGVCDYSLMRGDEESWNMMCRFWQQDAGTAPIALPQA